MTPSLLKIRHTLLLYCYTLHSSNLVYSMVSKSFCRMCVWGSFVPKFLNFYLRNEYVAVLCVLLNSTEVNVLFGVLIRHYRKRISYHRCVEVFSSRLHICFRSEHCLSKMHDPDLYLNLDHNVWVECYLRYHFLYFDFNCFYLKMIELFLLGLYCLTLLLPHGDY